MKLLQDFTIVNTKKKNDIRSDKMLFSFTNKHGKEICTIEARDKLIAKTMYKEKFKNGEVTIPIKDLHVDKCQ